MTVLEFDLPHALDRTGIRHGKFADIAHALVPGDLLVVNTSATLAAAVDGRRGDGRPVTVHFSTALDGGSWLVELRPPVDATGPLPDVSVGERVELPDGVQLTVLAPFAAGEPSPRLWRVTVGVEGEVAAFLARAGRAIRYPYVTESYPLGEYQTVFARQPGSAEMPSAGRPFTAEIVTSSATGSWWRRSCCTPGCRPRSPARRRSRNASRSPGPPRGWPTSLARPGVGLSRSARR